MKYPGSLDNDTFSYSQQLFCDVVSYFQAKRRRFGLVSNVSVVFPVLTGRSCPEDLPKSRPCGSSAHSARPDHADFVTARQDIRLEKRRLRDRLVT